MNLDYIKTYLNETIMIAQRILTEQAEAIGEMIRLLCEVKAREGRVFFIGVGGGAGTCSHATNDMMKIAGISAICLMDNQSLMSALANDEGFESIFVRQMQMHKFNKNDCIFICSVGGGSDTTSLNITNAIKMAKEVGATVLGVVGRDTGYTARFADAAVVVPVIDESRVTPHSESFQLVIEHLLVNAVAQEGKK